MFKFHESIFSENHKSYYNETDLKALDECRTIVPNGRLLKAKDYDSKGYEPVLAPEDMCSIDTRDSYRCTCPLGYKLGPRGVMCKGKYDISFSFSSFWVSFKLLLEHWKDQKAPIATVACSLIGW